MKWLGIRLMQRWDCRPVNWLGIIFMQRWDCQPVNWLGIILIQRWNCQPVNWLGIILIQRRDCQPVKWLGVRLIHRCDCRPVTLSTDPSTSWHPSLTSHNPSNSHLGTSLWGPHYAWTLKDWDRFQPANNYIQYESDPRPEPQSAPTSSRLKRVDSTFSVGEFWLVL